MAPFYNHVAIEKGSRRGICEERGKVGCLDKVWRGCAGADKAGTDGGKCVRACVR